MLIHDVISMVVGSDQNLPDMEERKNKKEKRVTQQINRRDFFIFSKLPALVWDNQRLWTQTD